MVLAVAPLTDLANWARGSGLEIVLFVTGAVLLSRAARWFIDRMTARSDAGPISSEGTKHRLVLAQGVTWAVIAVIYCVAAVLVLTRLGVPITSLVAPAAVLGVALGFGAQRLVQDLLAGLFIIGERQYGFGDVIRISQLGSADGVSGTVEEVTLRVTRLRTFGGEVVIIPNGQIVQVTNMSRDWARAVVDVPVPATADVNQVHDILDRLVKEVSEDKKLGPLLLDAPSVLGVESLEVDTLHVRVVARTLPGKQFEVGRELRSRIAEALHAAGIMVVATVEAADPVAAT